MEPPLLVYLPTKLCGTVASSEAAGDRVVAAGLHPQKCACLLLLALSVACEQHPPAVEDTVLQPP